jgi:tRNA A-37 threonylcarbamoyl transferase component Bud32
VCLALGWLLRSARYTQTPVVDQSAHPVVRKRRAFYAPLLIWMGDLAVRILDTGQRVLAQREWEERERLIYQTVYGTSIQVEADGTLVLPYLGGQTLAALLEDPKLDEPARKAAIERAVVALSRFHQLGFTHADAMAENVLIDSRGAHWFDFETMHDANRPMTWRRADDLRALLSTCWIRAVPERQPETVHFVLDAYADEDVRRAVAMSFTTVWRRSLAFHLAQAAMSFQGFHEIGRLLRERKGFAHS